MSDSLVGLGSYDKAIQTIEIGINKNKNKEDVLKLKTKLNEIHQIKSIVEKNLEKLQLFQDLENQERLKLFETLTLRNIKLKPQYHKIPINYEGKIYLDSNNDLHFPFLIIYDEFNITDYIQVNKTTKTT